MGARGNVGTVFGDVRSTVRNKSSAARKAADDEMMSCKGKSISDSFFIVPSQVMMSFSIKTQNEDKSSRHLNRP